MPIGPDLFELGHARMAFAHEMILGGALLGALSVIAGLLSDEFGWVTGENIEVSGGFNL